MTLSYQEDYGNSGGQCIDQLTATVGPTAGHGPAARLQDILDDDDGVGIVFSAPGGCALTKPASVAVTVRGHGATSTLRSRDECQPGSWRVSGRTPGVSTSQTVAASGSTIGFHAAGNTNQTYQGDRTRRRPGRHDRPTTTTRQRPGCSRAPTRSSTTASTKNKQFHSYHLNLFWWRPGSTSRWLTWRTR